MMSGYFAEAGVLVGKGNEASHRVPPIPAELGDIAARWGVEFWRRPIDLTTPAPAAT